MRRRWAVAALLLGTALLYLIGLSDSGWANSYYSAAAQAAGQSWKAFLFGSFDSAGFITVDKTPASLWLMGLSVRLFGLHSWAILAPQALCGVATVGVLYAAVKRWMGHLAGLIAGVVMALTPVAVLMFRFNNPDALLVLVLVVGAYAITRAVQSGQTRWLVLAGSAVGVGFLTKMLQAFLVIPVFGLVYLVAGPPKLGKRLWQLGAAVAALVVSAGWWVALVELWPAGSRPYIGGSQTNSILELTLGYNGLGRITGDETGSVGGGGAGGPGGPGGGLGGGGRWGETGVLRLFNDSYGGQASWLMPLALIVLGAGLWATRRRPRTDLLRAGFVIWGGWLVVTGLVFSFMAGIIHEYYTVVLAPAIGGLVGGGGVLLWRLRRLPWVVAVSAGAVLVTGCWAFVLLGRAATFVPWLKWAVLVGALAVTCGMLATLLLPQVFQRLGRRVLVRALALGGLMVGLAGPAAFAFQTAATAHAGSIVTAGPSSGFGPGGFAPGGQGGGGGFTPPGETGGAGGQGGFRDGRGGQAMGAPGGNQGNGGQGNGGQVDGGNPGMMGMPGGGGRMGGMGGLLNASTPGTELRNLLTQNADSYTWVAATIGSNNAAGIQLALGRPVMAIGGFNGSDDAPSLAQFQRWVAAGRIHYFLGGQGFQANGGSSVPQEIATWVTANYTATTVGGTTVYDLSAR